MTMRFRHSPEIWRDFPHLVPLVVVVDRLTPDASVDTRVAELTADAAGRLADRTESELPEVQAWRRAFGQLGVKPTQYRSAAESLLRRFRKDGVLPRLHPLVDLCNAASMAAAVPVAAFDLDRIDGDLEVRRATGTETYETFRGDTEQPDRGEVIFVDDAGRAHARRWTNRQSGASAIRAASTSALIVAEALHPTAAADVRALQAVLVEALAATWSTTPLTSILSASAPAFHWGQDGSA